MTYDKISEVLMKYLFAILLPWLAYGAEQMRILPVNPTPEPATAVLAIALPRFDEVVKRNPIYLQFRMDGFSLASSSSQFLRSQELAITDMGQTVHVIIDNNPYFPVNGPAIEPFEESGYYYDTSYKIELPYSLEEGMHIIRAFPARSFGESLKGETAFQTSVFFVGNRTNTENIDLSKPFLTYNEPSDQFHYEEGRPVLLDFLISNCELTKDGYKVKLTVDGRFTRMLTSWQPYYIYGLSEGKHTIRLELFGQKDVLIPGPFNRVERTIVIHQR